jgi:photosynthetic reaction center cytochrome c subunit
MNRPHSLMRRGARLLAALVAGAGLLMLAGCERPPMESVQHGFRGTGMVHVVNPRTIPEKIEANEVPMALPAAPAEGPKSSQAYQNVQVLGDLSTAQFVRLMTSMTSWIAPGEGCGYCHNLANFAEDSKYTKVVARRMLQMTAHINANWKDHVADTGVTCWTCHRGNPVPANVWFKADTTPLGADFIGEKAGQNEASPVVGLASLPNDPFTPFLLGDLPIRVNGATALPAGNRQSIKQAEWTYGLMVHMSTGLGVNCTYCHNTQNFAKWEGGPPQRVKAWYGIRMARDLNVAFMEPLTPVFPPHRKGELGDVAKANCATCHQGAYKPLNGQPMLKDFPELAAALAKPASADAAKPATKVAAKAPAK